MNPFTKALSSRLRERRLRDFVARWDAVEALVVRVYRAGVATAQDEAAYARLRAWLTHHYPMWQAALEPNWRVALRGGKPCEADPFAEVLEAPRAAHFVGNWACMQALPAAREALNRLILERST